MSRLFLTAAVLVMSTGAMGQTLMPLPPCPEGQTCQFVSGVLPLQGQATATMITPPECDSGRILVLEMSGKPMCAKDLKPPKVDK